jgi:hypothetical protein
MNLKRVSTTTHILSSFSACCYTETLVLPVHSLSMVDSQLPDIAIQRNIYSAVLRLKVCGVAVPI